MEVINRKEYDTITSNLVYPAFYDKKSYQILGKLDNDYVTEYLVSVFDARYIGNKYAIKMDNGLLIYRHDNSYYLLKQL
jgi:hypothetical protein